VQGSHESFERESLHEVEVIQNPALGAFLIWSAGSEYKSIQSESLPLHLSFLVLPLLLHRQTLNVINSTNKSSGLALLASKIGERKDDLLAVHTRAYILRV
jgi:hypothetical protein